jgi:circadian clock protein KaiB
MMMTNKEGNLLQHWDIEASETFSLRLFVAGASSISVRAITNLRLILEDNLKDRYELEIIDIHQQPLLVKAENIFAVPLLIKKQPLPLKRLVGDMSDKAKVLKGLGLI